MKQKINRSVRENILLWMSGATGLGVLPFAIYRYSIQQWNIAIMDTFVSIFTLSIFGYIYKTRNVNVGVKFLLALVMIGVIFSVYLKGPHQVYWAFPASIASFYLLKPKSGAVLTILFFSALIFILRPTMPLFELTAFLVTLSITTLFAYVFSKSIAEQRKQLLVLATIDPLTGAGNRRALKDKLDHVIASNHRNPGKTSLLLIDLDYFKNINDQFGHNTGDVFLTEITRIIKSRIRAIDSLFRFGGEEFIVVAENTDINAAKVLSEVLRSTIESSKILPQASVTISIGVAVIRENETDEQWIKRADNALFRAKENGRNQVCYADPIDSKNNSKAS